MKNIDLTILFALERSPRFMPRAKKSPPARALAFRSKPETRCRSPVWQGALQAAFWPCIRNFIFPAHRPQNPLKSLISEDFCP